MPECFALILNDRQLCVVDMEGSMRSFSCQNSASIQDLCFSSHANVAVDDLLTPCFDEEGRHGSPEEGCFCGLEEPHIHAHIYDASKCCHENEKTSTAGAEDSLKKLAQITLVANEQSTDNVEISSTARFRNECNSKNLVEIHSTRMCPLFSVKHDDHVDTVVRDEINGNIMIEHDSCAKCTGRDCHGLLVGDEERKWDTESAESLVFRIYRAATPRGDKISLQDIGDPLIVRDVPKKVERFATAVKRPNKKAPVEPLTATAKPTSTQSSCCSSKAKSCCGDMKADELPSCCKPNKCGETDCCSSLEDNKCGNRGDVGGPPSSCCNSDATGKRCCVETPAPNTCCNKNIEPCYVKKTKDEGCCSVETCCTEVDLQAAESPPKDSARRSTLYVHEICCATEVAAIRSILDRMDGIDKMRVNVTSKLLYVDHDVKQIEASAIRDELNRERFGARIEHDGALDTAAISSIVTSVLSIENPLTKEDGDAIVDFLSSFGPREIKSSVVDDQRITIVHNTLLLPATKISSRISEALNLIVVILRDGKDALEWDFSDIAESDLLDKEKEITPTEPAFPRVAVIISGILWVVSMLSHIGSRWENLKYVGVVSVAFGLPRIVLKAATSLRSCRFDVNCLMTTAALGALALQDYTEAAAVTFLFAMSEWLEARATSRARNALSAILHLRPEKAHLIHPQNKELITVPVKAVPVGALVSVKAGDKIPCDGIVVEGFSTVDESSLTGESRPVRKGPDDFVSGGTINSGNTQMTVRTSASADDSAVARLIRLVEEAQANRSETEKLVDEFARYYTPTLLIIALGMCTIPWAWGEDVGKEWAELGLVLIVVACPCALIISTPVSYVAGLAAMAQRGVLIKGGAHLEALGLVKTVCFDKTGTLTKGKFQLLHLDILASSHDRVKALQYISLMEDRASHPLAQALVDGARNEGVKIPTDTFVRNHTFLAGEGVVGMIDKSEVYVGNVRLFRRLGLYQSLSETVRQRVETWEKIGTVGFMSIDEGIVCVYCVADAVRDESSDVIQQLQGMGIEVLMLTGDHHTTASSIGHMVGLQECEIKSQLFPQEKLDIVTEFRDDKARGNSVLANLCSVRRLVLMCGDGVNDAPALAAADIGVAVAGSALAMETADVTLLDSHLSKLLYALNMGRRVIRKIKENVVFSLFVKFLVLGFALVGKAALWAAIASDVGAMLLVTINSMLLLPGASVNKSKAITSIKALEL